MDTLNKPTQIIEEDKSTSSSAFSDFTFRRNADDRAVNPMLRNMRAGESMDKYTARLSPSNYDAYCLFSDKELLSK